MKTAPLIVATVWFGWIIALLFWTLFMNNKKPQKETPRNIFKEEPLTAQEAKELAEKMLQGRAHQLKEEALEDALSSIRTQATLGRNDTIINLSFEYDNIPQEAKRSIRESTCKELRDKGYRVKEERDYYFRIYW